MVAEDLVARVVDESHDLDVGQVCLQLGCVLVEHDGQDSGALLAGGLGDELLGPVGEADDVRTVGHDGELVAQR